MGCNASRNIQIGQESVAAAKTEELATGHQTVVLLAKRRKQEESNEPFELPRSSIAEACFEPCTREDELGGSSISLSNSSPPARVESPATERPRGIEDPPIPAKTVCCRNACLVTNSGICCEHDFTRAIGNYCSLCRKRDEDWHAANQVFEDLVQEIENSPSLGLCSKDSNTPVGDQENSGSFVTYPSWDRFNSLLASHRVLPCGHTVCRCPSEILEPCPFCTMHEEQWGRKSRKSSCLSHFLCESRQEEYEGIDVVCFQPGTNGLHWSSESRRCAYFSRTSMVSSLGESSTGSVRSCSTTGSTS